VVAVSRTVLRGRLRSCSSTSNCAVSVGSYRLYVVHVHVHVMYNMYMYMYMWHVHCCLSRNRTCDGTHCGTENLHRHRTALNSYEL
jgi:hypothetical protein